MTALLLLGSAMAYADGFSRSGNSVTIQVAKPQCDGAKMVRLEVVNENIIRVRATPEETFPEKTSIIIVPQKAKPQFARHSNHSVCRSANSEWHSAN